MKEIVMYKANDGKLFAMKDDCEKHDRNLEEAEMKTNIIFFNCWGDKTERYDTMKVDYLYIPYEEFEFAKTLLKRHHRELVAESPSNFYYGYNMAVYPIERKFEKQKEQIARLEAEFKRDERLVQGMLKKVKKPLDK